MAEVIKIVKFSWALLENEIADGLLFLPECEFWGFN